MNVLSLFDGISCGRLALQSVGIPISTYHTSEIDRYASAIARYHFPDNIELGDITNWKSWNIDFSRINLILAGFPCQAFSLAGKQKGVEDPRGKLAIVLCDIFNHIKAVNPSVLFLFENVKMKKENLTFFDGLFGVNHIIINSSLVSAQHRERVYWTNIPNITHPEDKGIILQDILEGCQHFTDREKSYCIDANYFKGGNLEQYFDKCRRQLVFSKNGLCQVGIADLKGNDCIKRVYHGQGKSPTLTTMGGGHREPKVLVGEHLWRKLTVLECERLQTLPDHFTLNGVFNGKIKVISNTQRYKCIGNGWTVDIIAHILKNII